MLRPLAVAAALLFTAACDANGDIPLRPDAAVEQHDSGPVEMDATVTDASAGDAAPDTGIGGCGTVAGTGRFPTFPDSCRTTTDCVMVIHQLDCCGSHAARGIAATARDEFDNDEAIWRASCPACGCAPQPTTAQDGKAGDISTIRVTCAGADAGSGVCRTYVQ